MALVETHRQLNYYFHLTLAPFPCADVSRWLWHVADVDLTGTRLISNVLWTERCLRGWLDSRTFVRYQSYVKLPNVVLFNHNPEVQMAQKTPEKHRSSGVSLIHGSTYFLDLGQSSTHQLNCPRVRSRYMASSLV